MGLGETLLLSFSDWAAVRLVLQAMAAALGVLIVGFGMVLLSSVF